MKLKDKIEETLNTDSIKKFDESMIELTIMVDKSECVWLQTMFWSARTYMEPLTKIEEKKDILRLYENLLKDVMEGKC